MQSEATIEPSQFELAVRPTLRGLRGAALRLTRNAADADDLLQETVLRAWRFWSHYETGSNLRAWLHRILVNTFVNRYRRARREREVLALARDCQPEPLPEPAVARGGFSDEVEQGLSQLPTDFRNVLWAVAVDDLSYREAADALGCPIGTVMSRLSRARTAMQGTLGSYALAHGYA